MFLYVDTGISSHSLHSVDSFNSDAQDEMNASTLSLSSLHAPSLTKLPYIGSLSPSSSYEISGYEPAPSLLRQRQARSSDKPKDCDEQSDFYSWWDENLVKDKVL